MGGDFLEIEIIQIGLLGTIDLVTPRLTDTKTTKTP